MEVKSKKSRVRFNADTKCHVHAPPASNSQSGPAYGVVWKVQARAAWWSVSTTELVGVAITATKYIKLHMYSTPICEVSSTAWQTAGSSFKPYQLETLFTLYSIPLYIWLYFANNQLLCRDIAITTRLLRRRDILPDTLLAAPLVTLQIQMKTRPRFPT